MLSIGEFSRFTHLSVRTLRRYHDVGLLEPATVDPSSGYRYYSTDQIPTAQVIHRPGGATPTLEGTIAPADDRVPSALVAEHLSRLESQLERTRAAVSSLQRLLRPEVVPSSVEVRSVPAVTVAAIEDDVDLDDVLVWYAGAMAELGAAVSSPTGSPGGLYDNALFETGHGHVLVYLPPTPPTAGRVRPVTLPAVELAVAVHVGEHDDIDVTYGELGTWVAHHALQVDGPVRDLPRRPATRPTRRPGAPRSAGPSSTSARPDATT
ncbi:MAG: MerR family transcriptional regulator [Ilumatobacteraceae bacterium]